MMNCIVKHTRKPIFEPPSEGIRILHFIAQRMLVQECSRSVFSCPYRLFQQISKAIIFINSLPLRKNIKTHTH